MIARKKYKLILMISLVLLFTIKAQAQLSISLPDTSGFIGATMNIPVMVDEITEDDSVNSFQFNVQYDESFIFISGIETDGTVLDGQSVITNPNYDTGKIRLAYAGLGNIVGSGVLLYLVVELNAVGESPLNWDDTRFFDGTGADVPLNLTDGSLEVMEIPPLEPPVLTSPTNGENGLEANVYFRWQDADRATKYDLQVSLNSGFTSILVDRDNIPYNSALVTGLAYETTFWWRVRSVNDEETSPWSVIWSFTTGEDNSIPLPGQVSLTSPEDAATFPRDDGDYWMDFMWSQPDGEVEDYQIDVASDEAFSNILYTNDQVAGTDISVSDLEWADTYYWRVRAGNDTGWGPYSNTWSFSFLLVDVEDEELINEYKLNQNYPNPFNPSTTISYNIPEVSNVKLEVYNVIGQFVTTLFNGQQTNGYYEFNWDARGLSSGIYIYTLEASSVVDSKNQFVMSKSMLLMK